jgi:glycosyltransferase involved in cell wall biosynthesis
MDNNTILSICIPTYNGASSFLNEVLETACKILQSFEGVEVIVSDNCSTDNTNNVVQEYSKKEPRIRSYRNPENLGFNKNMLLLMDQYAKGDYLWMIGDDDIINIDALHFILEVLKKGAVDYLSLSYKYISPDEYIDCNNAKEVRITHNNVYTIHHCSFAQAIDENCRRGNSFGTFMGATIVRRNIFNSVSKDIIENKFDVYYNVWPNAYINATGFFDKACAFIPEVSIFSILRHKGWTEGDNSFKFLSVYNVQMYQYFRSLGIKESELKITHTRVLYDYMWSSYLRLFRGKKINKNFLKIWLESFKYPIVRKTIYSNLLRLLKSKITRQNIILDDVG